MGIATAEELRLEAQDVAAVAETVEPFVNLDLTPRLLPMLREMRDLRLNLGCRFLWRRLEELDDSVCESLAPTIARGAMQTLILACAASISVWVQYKVWRHLKDNKVIGKELDAFERRLAIHQRQMVRLTAAKKAREAKEAQYQQAVASMMGDSGQRRRGSDENLEADGNLS